MLLRLKATTPRIELGTKTQETSILFLGHFSGLIYFISEYYEFKIAEHLFYNREKR